MKKITTGILATLACLACLSGCSGKGNEKDPTGIEASVALEGAKAFLEAKYKKQVSEVSANYEMPNTVSYDGVTYEITWSVDVEKDVIVERDDEEGITYINVNESAAEDVKYVLTGTIKDADGNELKVEFKCKLLQGPTTAAVRIPEAPVVGTAYKLYVYQGANSAHIYANGKMKNTYYFDTTTVAEEGIDIYVEAVEGKEGKFYLYHNVVKGEGEEATTTKTYINIVKSGSHTNAKYETTATTEYVFDNDYKTMVTDLDGTTFYLGCDGTYNTIEPQKERGEGYYTAYLSGIVEKSKVTDDIKLETAFNTLSMPAVYVDEFDTALPTQDSTFTDVKINWECDSDKVSLGKNINDTQKTTFTAGSTTDTIVLKAVMTCGEETATKEFSIKLVPNDGEAIAAAALELPVGASFGNEATLTGMITKLNKSGLEQYGNIDASMAANGNVDTIIGCYHLVGITDYQVKDVDYGYNVTVKGILTNYNGTIQFAKDCEVVSFTTGSRNDIPGIKTTPADIVDAAYALQDGKSMYVDYTLTGVITKVDTEYSSANGNITVTIAVEGKEDKPITCYRLKGTGVDVIKVGDTITVTGTLKNYKGTVEFDTGCTLDSYVVGEGGGEVTPPAGGDVETSTADYAFTVTNLNIPSQSYCTSETTATINGTNFAFIQIGNYGNGLQWRTKEGVSGSLWNTTALSGNLTKIVFTPNSKYGNYTNAYTLALGNTADCNEKTVSFNTTGNGQIATVEIEGEYTFFKITHANSNTQYFDSIEIFCEEAAPKYSLTLRNGNPMMGGSMEEVEYEEGATLELDPLTADGKKFLGWFALDGEGNPTVAAPATMPAEPVALYAVWEVIPYTLTIKQDGAEDKTFTFGVEYTNDITVTVNDLAYVLEDNLPEGFVWEENVPETFALQDYTFTAISAAVPKYTLTLRNGNPMAGGSMEELEYVEGAALELDPLTADGKNFKGWFALDGEGNPTVAAPTTMPAEAIALFAVWEVIPYTLTIKQADVEDKTFTFAVEYTNDILISVNDLAYVLEENLPANTETLTYSWAEEVPETFALQDYTFTVAVEETVVTIEDALAAADGTKAKLSGTVSSIYQEWSDQFSNMSFYVTDGTKTILVFRAGTKVGVGDAVDVNGVVALYNGTNQIAQGATVTVTAAHVCSTFTEADCLNAAVCTVCGTVNGSALGHLDENADNSCDRCQADLSSAAKTVTASKSIADLIASEGWTSSTTKQTFKLDDNVTVKVNGGSNTGKAYEGTHNRIYATDTPAGTLTISVPTGYELVSVKISTQTGTYAFLYVDGTTTDICNQEVAVSGTSVLLNSVKNGSNGKQVRVTAIDVTYKAV